MWFWDRRGGESSVGLKSCGNFFQETNLTSSVLIRIFFFYQEILHERKISQMKLVTSPCNVNYCVTKSFLNLRNIKILPAIFQAYLLSIHSILLGNNFKFLCQTSNNVKWRITNKIFFLLKGQFNICTYTTEAKLGANITIWQHWFSTRVLTPL